MNFQDDIPSIPIDKFKNQSVLVFSLTSKQDATENFHSPTIWLEPNFTFPLEYVTEFIVLGR